VVRENGVPGSRLCQTGPWVRTPSPGQREAHRSGWDLSCSGSPKRRERGDIPGGEAYAYTYKVITCRTASMVYSFSFSLRPDKR